ncbi:hypothetical protein WJS89_10360 [Sphingomicrobium sp. XHP0235]|uniref:hypothetical protein n=1 Tax=Sphingomicrobium aquimarinum TaxID=3133971 RepID=UPI0031FEC492
MSLQSEIERLREILKPAFDRQHAIEERECPQRVELLRKMQCNISYAGGNCPVQIEGTVKGEPFYFRARGEHWSLGIGGDPVGEPEWYHEEGYGNWPNAGWMPLHEAYDFLASAIGAWEAASATPMAPTPAIQKARD